MIKITNNNVYCNLASCQLKPITIKKPKLTNSKKHIFFQHEPTNHHIIIHKITHKQQVPIINPLRATNDQNINDIKNQKVK